MTAAAGGCCDIDGEMLFIVSGGVPATRDLAQGRFPGQNEFVPLPAFPEFQRLPVTARAAYQKLFGRLSAPYCDFSLNNLLIWLDCSDDLELSVHGGCAVLRFSSAFENNRRRYALFGTFNVDDAVRDVLEFIAARGEVAELGMIPEEAIERIVRKQGLVISEESWNADYVFHAETALRLQGKRYANLRQRVNAFETRYSRAERADLDLRDRQTNRLVRRLFADWIGSTHSRQNDLEGIEARAIAKHLDLAGSIPVEALGTFVDGRLVSVGLYHCPPQPGWIILNHIVSDQRYKGAFGHAFHQMIRQACDTGKTWLNAEQDLGRPGLRQAKSLLRPHRFLRRYSVSLAE